MDFDLEGFGILCFLFVIPYTVALQILLITFVRKYIGARREIMQIKQDDYNRQAGAAGRIYQPAPYVPVEISTPAIQQVPVSQSAQPVPALQQTATLQQASQSVPKKKSKISSTSITFGVGVLLLTIVGASFLSVSWSFMGDAMRALTLFAAVAVVYFLAFLSGRVLKLKQTGFAFYTLASFLGPIVIVGVGMFSLFGKGFSFRFGTGWIVAAVAAGVMALSALIGKLIYQSHFYTGITYFSFTWLVAFVSGQMGDYSVHAYPIEIIFIAIALLALILRVMVMLSKDKVKLSFSIYAELMAYIAPVLMFVAIVSSKDYNSIFLLIGSVITNIELIVHARFTPKREWLKYIIPAAFFGLYITLTFDMKYPREVWPLFVLFIALYAVYFLLKINTLVSDILFTSFFAFTVLAYDTMGKMIYIPVIIAAGIACITASISAVFAKNKPAGGINAFIAAFWYYVMSISLMIKLTGGKEEENYFIYVLPVAVVTAFVLTLIRRFAKDDYRIRIGAEVLIWSSLFAGTIGLFIAESYWSTVGIDNTLIRLFANGILLFLDGMLLGYNYFINAKKKEGLSIASLIVTSLVLNAPLYVALIPAIWGELPRAEVKYGFSIAYCVMCAVMAGVLVMIRFVPRFGQGRFALYAKPLKHIVSALLLVWIIAETYVSDQNWMICILPVVMLVLYFCGNKFLAVLPLIMMQFAINDFLRETLTIRDNNFFNLVLTVIVIVQFALGRLFYPKKIVSSKGMDYLAFVPLMLCLEMKYADYCVMVAFLVMALMIFNFIGRTKIPSKIVATIASVPVVIALINQPFINLSDVYMLEFYLAIIIADAAVIRYLVKPAEDKILRICWFALISVSMVIEGISAAVTEETFDLIVTGVAAVAIFLFSFIQKSRLWFILGVVSIIGIAIYLSATFWSSMAWLLYLLIAGIIMIVIAAGNEWRKRHSSEGKKLFKEWKW